jgi:putative phosphoribosyl transferase
MTFADRIDAGRQLAGALAAYAADDPVVIGLPRGGVVVGAEIARALAAPLDVCVVRKVGAPWFPELGVGAVAEGGARYLNHELIAEIGASPMAVDHLVHERQAEVAALVGVYREGAPAQAVAGRTVIVVDDGIATGGTVLAALQSIVARKPGPIVVATPVASKAALDRLRHKVHAVVCLHAIDELLAVGAWYSSYEPLADRDVVELLAKVNPRPAGTGR